MAELLPDFDDPPVIEVVLSVQFNQLTQLLAPHLGVFWSDIRDDYSKIEDHDPLISMVEEFELGKPQEINIKLAMSDKPPLRRCWFLNKEGTELIQVQPDRFIYNWRKIEGSEYPRFKHVRAKFEKAMSRFRSFLSREKIGEIVPNQADVTYVNHIIAGKGWDKDGQLSQVLTLFKADYSEEFLPNIEDAGISVGYVIPDPDGNPIGRLHVGAKSVYRRLDRLPMIVLTLTARGRPTGEGLEGVLGFFDVGHKWIVRGFSAITTPEMHKIWERQDDK